jgi:hypothetical protein
MEAEWRKQYSWGFPLYHYLFPISIFHSFSSFLFCLSLSSLSISYVLSFSPQHPSLFLTILCQICFFLTNSSIFFSVKAWECRIFKFSVHYYDDGCPSGGSVPSPPFIWENIRVFLSILFYNFHFHGLDHEIELKYFDNIG